MSSINSSKSEPSIGQGEALPQSENESEDETRREGRDAAAQVRREVAEAGETGAEDGKVEDKHEVDMESTPPPSETSENDDVENENEGEEEP